MALDPNVDWANIARMLEANPATQDAAYMAFMRQMGAAEANIKNEIQARTETVQRSINRAAAGYQMQKKGATEGVANDFESRGLYNSGTRIIKQDEAGAKVDYDRQQFEAGETDALAEASRRANADLSDWARKRTEEDFNARRRIGEQRAQQVFNPTAAPR